MDLHWLYAELDPDPAQIQVNKIAKLISNNLLKVEKKIYFQTGTNPKR